MKDNPLGTHVFWGANAPLSTLISVGLMLMATSRLAFALTVAAGLVWIYGLSVLALSFGKPILPKRGLGMLRVFLSSFLGSLYLLLLQLANPVLAMETTFLILLCPLSCIASGVCSRAEPLDYRESFFKALFEALSLGGLLVALALIREPLGFGSLSFPGGPQGMVFLFFVGSSGSFFPVRIVANASGGLLLLGYGLAVFRRYRDRFSRRGGPK